MNRNTPVVFTTNSDLYATIYDAINYNGEISDDDYVDNTVYRLDIHRFNEI